MTRLQHIVDTLTAERDQLLGQRATLDAQLTAVEQAIESLQRADTEARRAVSVTDLRPAGARAFERLPDAVSTTVIDRTSADAVVEMAQPAGPMLPTQPVDRRSTIEPSEAVSRQVTDLQLVNAVRALGDQASPGLVAERLGMTTSGLRPRLRDLADRQVLVITGVTNSRRITLGPKAQPPAPREPELEKVWAPHRDAPSLTGGAAGLGTTLGGASFKVHR